MLDPYYDLWRCLEESVFSVSADQPTTAYYPERMHLHVCADHGVWYHNDPHCHDHTHLACPDHGWEHPANIHDC